LSHWLGARDYLQGMLGEFPGYTNHVRWMPCKYVSVLTEELDERAFLIGGQICPNCGGLGSVASDKLHLLCVNRRLEGGRVIRLKRIYNFLCSMLVYTPFALCFVTLRGIFMHFPELTY
jgi:hypothetical protein